LAGLATVQERKGDLDAALSLLERRVDTGHELPIFSQSYALVCRRLHQPERALVMVERCLQTAPSGEDEAGLLHAYGDLLDALGRHDEAFSAHTQANQARCQPFDAESHHGYITAIERVFSRDRFSEFPRSSSTAEPIFVVGMPRSGTSLVEQILASHSAVYGAGELSGILDLAAKLPFHLHDRRPYPDCMDAVSGLDLQSLAKAYENSLPGASLSAAHTVDKMPFNFLHLGLIATLFPKAKIVHCMRNPADTCLSVFFQQFSPFYAFSTSLKGLGHYYRDYLRLMAHWGEHLPIPIHHVAYERLVSEPEEAIPELLQACGLSHEPACSRFWENPRQVDTASYAQVRQPLYTSSIQRSEPYLEYLAPLLRILEAT
jgi:tetratricopeptide (TPR) repeat protein